MEAGDPQQPQFRRIRAITERNPRGTDLLMVSIFAVPLVLFGVQRQSGALISAGVLLVIAATAFRPVMGAIIWTALCATCLGLSFLIDDTFQAAVWTILMIVAGWHTAQAYRSHGEPTFDAIEPALVGGWTAGLGWITSIAVLVAAGWLAIQYPTLIEDSSYREIVAVMAAFVVAFWILTSAVPAVIRRSSRWWTERRGSGHVRSR